MHAAAMAIAGGVRAAGMDRRADVDDGAARHQRIELAIEAVEQLRIE